MKLLPFISIFLIALILPTGTSAQIIKELPQKQELDNFTASLGKSSYFTNIATIDAINQHPTWPHDVWANKKGDFYISFYYANNESSQGYSSVYYDDYGNKLPSNCRIALELIEPYYGLNVTENTTDPIEVIPDESINPGNSTSLEVENGDVYNNTFVGDEINDTNYTDESGNVTAENSTGVIVAHGLKNDIKQIIMDWTNVNLSNVSFNFWG